MSRSGEFCWLICLQNYGCCLWLVLGRNDICKMDLEREKSAENSLTDTQGSPYCTWGSLTLPVYRSQTAELCLFFLCVFATSELPTQQVQKPLFSIFTQWWFSICLLFVVTLWCWCSSSQDPPPGREFIAYKQNEPLTLKTSASSVVQLTVLRKSLPASPQLPSE